MKREIVVKSSNKDNALTQHVKRGVLDRQAYDYMVKVIVVGDSGVGKTNIISRYCCKEGEQGAFRDYHVATIGVDFSTKVTKVEGKRLKLQIWDTAGQQRFRTITQTYYKGAGGIILVFSVDSQESFLNIENWMKQIDQRSAESVLKVLVANKIDVEDDYSEQFYQDQPRKISGQRGRALAERYGMDYYEVSAKNNEGIEQMFGQLALHIRLAIQKTNIIQNGVQQIQKTLTINSGYTRTYRKVIKEGIEYKIQQDSYIKRIEQRLCSC